MKQAASLYRARQ